MQGVNEDRPPTLGRPIGGVRSQPAPESRSSLHGVVTECSVHTHMHMHVQTRISVCAFPTDAANATGALAGCSRETAVRIEQRCNAFVLGIMIVAGSRERSVFHISSRYRNLSRESRPRVGCDKRGVANASKKCKQIVEIDWCRGAFRQLRGGANTCYC